MLIFRKGHSHIKQDYLSAYLGGQISEAYAVRIDQRLAQCADCRQELDAMRSTVSLLQQMSELTLPRNFIMPGPPPAPIAIRPPAPLRRPQRVYSGSAAVAALVLDDLISADATGLLALDIPARTLQSTSAAATAPQGAPERLQADGSEAALEMAAARLEAQDDSEAAAPVAAMAEAQLADAAKAESAAPPTVADLAYAEAEVMAETTATPRPAVSALTTPDKPSGQALVAQEQSGGIPPARNSFTFWRILEGVTAITALTFLVVWLLRRWTRRYRYPCPARHLYRSDAPSVALVARFA